MAIAVPAPCCRTAGNPSLVPQRLDRVQPRRTPGRHVAEHHAVHDADTLTSKLTAATAPSSVVMMRVVPESVSAI